MAAAITSVEALLNNSFSMVNGAVEQAPPIHIGGDIAPGYMQPLDANNGFISGRDHIESIELEAAASSALMATQNVMANEHDKRRATAYLMAVVRVRSRAAYGITRADVETSQCRTIAATVQFNNGPAPPGAPANAVGPPIASDFQGGAAAAINAELVAVRAADYRANAPKGLFQVLNVVPVLVGIQLVRSGHHFLSDDMKVFSAVTQQFMGTREPKAFDLTFQEFCNAAFHKAAHPIVGSKMKNMAVSTDVKSRLDLMGYTSATVRMPATPPALAAYSAYTTLIKQMSVFAADNGVNFGDASAQMQWREDYFRSIFDWTITQPNYLVLQNALYGAVRDDMAKVEDNVAFVAGMYKGMCESMNLTNPSLRKSQALNKLEDAPTFTLGMQYYDQVHTKKRRDARDGKITPMALFGAQKAASYEAASGNVGPAPDFATPVVPAELTVAGNQFIARVAQPVAAPAPALAAVPANPQVAQGNARA